MGYIWVIFSNFPKGELMNFIKAHTGTFGTSSSLWVPECQDASMHVDFDGQWN